MKGVWERMGKRFFVILVSLLLLLVFVVSVQAQQEVVKVVLDGVELEFTVAPLIKEGRLMVPIRDLVRGFGADVSWDEENRTVFIRTGGEKVEFRSGFYRPDKGSLPKEIRDWIDYSREVPAVQEKHHNGHRYVLITEGMKPTGGYSVEVTKVVEGGAELEILISSSEPKEGQMVTQALTYPHDLIILENEDLPLRFTDIRDPDRHFMRLLGPGTIDRPLVASSEWIKVFSPLPGEEVKDRIRLTGIASVFEGTVSYELLTKGDQVLERGFITAAMLDWGYFERTIHLAVDTELDGLTLQLYSESAKDGSKAYMVEIPLSPR
ncbi:MAG: protease complex subunit PrcB family protein [Firmicutes bacterium]|nr:protease complex subunit PrcB family protein [Bacillota bacterium]